MEEFVDQEHKEIKAKRHTSIIRYLQNNKSRRLFKRSRHFRKISGNFFQNKESNKYEQNKHACKILFEHFSFDLRIFQMQLINVYSKNLESIINQNILQFSGEDFKFVISQNVQCLKKQIWNKLIDFYQTKDQLKDIQQFDQQNNSRLNLDNYSNEQIFSENQIQTFFPKETPNLQKLHQFGEKLNKHIQRASTISQFFSINTKLGPKPGFKTKTDQITHKSIAQISQNLIVALEQIKRLKKQIQKLKNIINSTQQSKFQNAKSKFYHQDKINRNIHTYNQNQQPFLQTRIRLRKSNSKSNYSSKLNIFQQKRSMTPQFKLSDLVQNASKKQINKANKNLSLHQSNKGHQAKQQSSNSQVVKYLATHSNGKKFQQSAILKFYQQKYKFALSCKKKMR